MNTSRAKRVMSKMERLMTFLELDTWELGLIEIGSGNLSVRILSPEMEAIIDTTKNGKKYVVTYTNSQGWADRSTTGFVGAAGGKLDLTSIEVLCANVVRSIVFFSSYLAFGRKMD